MRKSETPQKRLCTKRQYHPGSVMILAFVSKFVKTPIHFVKPGVMVHQHYYPFYVLMYMIPQMSKSQKLNILPFSMMMQGVIIPRIPLYTSHIVDLKS